MSNDLSTFDKVLRASREVGFPVLFSAALLFLADKHLTGLTGTMTEVVGSLAETNARNAATDERTATALASIERTLDRFADQLELRGRNVAVGKPAADGS